MCDNSSLATGALSLQSAGALTSTVGSYFSSSGQKQALGAQANIDTTNARIQEDAAQGALVQGAQQEQNQRFKTASLKGSQRASIGASGVTLDSDTASRVLASTDIMGDIDANTINANAVKSAWGYRTQAANYQNDALLKNAQAKGINPLESATSTLLTGAGSVAKSYYQLKKSGAFDND